jgi:23S rRNA (uridine2552-2'-O)-methyltransferase
VSWRRDQTRDKFFREAKRQHYRARSAFKLLELNRRLRLVGPGDAVVDLGAAPGSWSQVLVELVGPGGQVVAADLSPIEPLAGVATLRADICDSETAGLLRDKLGRPADAVVSDVSPQISGNRIADHARSIALADCSLAIAREVSRPGAAFAVKVFQGEDFDAFVARVRQSYRQARVVVPEATRRESRESYVCGLGRL